MTFVHAKAEVWYAPQVDKMYIFVYLKKRVVLVLWDDQVHWDSTFSMDNLVYIGEL